jgi:ribosomal protein S18 acetylase RimI-like enzyme
MEIVLSSGALIHELNYLAKDTKHYRLSSIRISPPFLPHPKPTDRQLPGISTFAVMPKYQGRVIGSELLRHCLILLIKGLILVFL